MTTLSSKRFFIPKAFTVSWDDVKAWYDGVDRGVDDCTLVVTLQAHRGRSQKQTAVRELEELTTKNIREEKWHVTWEEHGYKFLFYSRQYFWNGREIYVTANEALFLYRWLILHDDTCEVQTHYLRNMRQRFGKTFLAEVTV
jgi:hypothetical protein